MAATASAAMSSSSNPPYVSSASSRVARPRRGSVDLAQCVMDGVEEREGAPLPLNPERVCEGREGVAVVDPARRSRVTGVAGAGDAVLEEAALSSFWR